MTPKVVSLEEATSLVADGAFLAVGGYFLSYHPVALVRELVRVGKRSLRVLAPLGSVDADLLIAGGCVSEIHFSMISLEQFGFAPNFRSWIEAGRVSAIEYPESVIIAGLRAANSGMPFGATRVGLGSDQLQLHPEFKVSGCPLTGEPYVAVPPLQPDVTVMHAPRADQWGNVQFDDVFLELELARASRTVIVTVEEIVPEGAIAGRVTIPQYLVDAVVEVPFGAHPTGCYPRYVFDGWHLLDYVAAGRDGFDGYLERYVRAPRTQAAYLEAAGGVERLMRLNRLALGDRAHA